MDRDDIMERLAAADPLDPAVLEAWRRSRMPEAVLSRVLSSPRASDGDSNRLVARRRWAWAGMTAVLVAAAVLGLAAWLTGVPDRRDTGDMLVSRGRALSALVASGDAHAGTGVMVPLDNTEEGRRARAALGGEMLRDLGAAAAVTANAATWGEAVTWIWAVYAGGDLPEASGIPLAGSWRGADAGKMVTLMRAGIVPWDAARLHAPRDLITAAEWESLLRSLDTRE
jgi:hypothetical protein